MTVEELNKKVEKMLSSKTNTMVKLKIKCWQYHSLSRIKNGNEPFTFENYNRSLGKQTYLDYIEFDFIDCDDIGGKQCAIEAVNHWYG